MPVVGGVMLAACAYAAAKGFETRARVAEVLFALMILPFLFMFIVAIMDADFSNLQPMLVTDARALVYGSIRLGFILTGLECLLLVSPYVPREKNLGRAVAGALGIAGLIIIAITAITIASLGQGVENEPWPVIRMMDVMNLPGAFIERQEALMFGFWIITAFALGNAMLFFGGLLVRDIFKKATLGVGVFLTTIAVFGVSIIPFSREEIYANIDYMFITSGLFFLVVLPLSLLFAAKITAWGNNKILAKTAAKTVAFLLFLTFAIVMLVGCWDRVEIENRAFVVAMGIDKGENENYTVTLSIPIIEEGDEEDEDGEKSAHIKSASGQTITEALKRLDSKNDKQLSYGQTKLIILGTDLLEDRELFERAIKALGNKLEAPRRIHVLAAKNPEEILSVNPPGESLPGLYVANIYRNKNKIGGQSFALDFERLSNGTDGTIIPKIKRNEDELQLSGAVVLKNRERTGNLSPEELHGFLWYFSNGNKGAVVTSEKISMKIESHKANISFQPSKAADSPMSVIIDVYAKGTVYELEETAQESEAIRKNLEVTFAQEILKEITATAEVFQNEHAVDGYNLLEHLRKNNYSLYQKHAENWHEIFPKLIIIPRVTVTI